MVPKTPSCYCTLLIQPSRLKFLRSLFHIYIIFILQPLAPDDSPLAVKYIIIIVIIIIIIIVVIIILRRLNGCRKRSFQMEFYCNQPVRSEVYQRRTLTRAGRRGLRQQYKLRLAFQWSPGFYIKHYGFDRSLVLFAVMLSVMHVGCLF